MDLVRKSNKADKEEEKLNRLDIKKEVYDTMFNPNDIIQNPLSTTYGLHNNLHKFYWNDVDFHKMTDESFFDFVSNAPTLADIE
jgi:hypothetical protein